MASENAAMASYMEALLKDLDSAYLPMPTHMEPPLPYPKHVMEEETFEASSRSMSEAHDHPHGKKRAWQAMSSASDEKANMRCKRMERKRFTEKMRRQEMNDRLEELLHVVEQVEIPDELPEKESDSSDTGKLDKDKGNHKVQLLGRAIRCLKNLRYAYDCRTAEVMKLALKMQHQGIQEAHMSGVDLDSAKVNEGDEVATQAPSSSSHHPGRNADPYVPMMLMMPILVPKGSKPCAPKIAPVSASMMGLFASEGGSLGTALAATASTIGKPPAPPPGQKPSSSEKPAPEGTPVSNLARLAPMA